MRSKRGARKQFQLDNEAEEQEGKVTKVGKPTGKDKNQYWIKGKDEEERSFDFSREVKGWRNIHHMNFVEGTEEKKTSQDMHRSDIKDDDTGTYG